MKRLSLPLPLIASGATLAAGLFFLQSARAADKPQLDYVTNGTCDGLPRVDLGTPSGMCVGLVFQDRTPTANASSVVFPRTMVEVGNNLFILVDMGGWAANNGRIFKVFKDGAGTWKKERIPFAGKINNPHGSAVHPTNKRVYVATNGGIFSFDPIAPKDDAFLPANALALLPAPAGARHPLAAIAFSNDGNTLFVNHGSASDNCELPGGGSPTPANSDKAVLCPEAEFEPARGKDSVRGIVRAYDIKADGTLGDFKIFASHLRNSMALAVHPKSGILLQAENSRDAIDKADSSLNDAEEPREELNVLERGGKYGWPYCYNAGVKAPEFPNNTDCTTMRKPALLLPAHVAPLGLTYYFADAFPSWYKGKALVTYHGYREYGHKLVAVPTDSNGKPTGEAPYEIINNWTDKDTTPQGSPTGVTVARDGSVFVIDDKNRAVLRLAYDSSKGTGLPTPGLSKSDRKDPDVARRCAEMAKRSSEFTRIEREVIDPSCSQCHGASAGFPGGLQLLRCDDIGNAKRLLERNLTGHAFIKPRDLNESVVYRAMSAQPGVPAMPAGGLPREQLELVEKWILNGAPLPATPGLGAGKATSTAATILKREPKDSTDLSSDKKCAFPAGSTLGFTERFPAERGHFRLELAGADRSCPTFSGTVYVFGGHFSFTK